MKIRVVPHASQTQCANHTHLSAIVMQASGVAAKEERHRRSGSAEGSVDVASKARGCGLIALAVQPSAAAPGVDFVATEHQRAASRRRNSQEQS